jgi:hypothetical protein
LVKSGFGSSFWWNRSESFEFEDLSVGCWQQQLSRVGVSPSWLRHRILIPAFAGSTPSTPAKFSGLPKADSGNVRIAEVAPGFDQARMRGADLMIDPLAGQCFFCDC